MGVVCRTERQRECGSVLREEMTSEMFGLYIIRLRPSCWTPRVQNHPGLRISLVAGTGLVDCTGARESLGS